MPFFCGDEVANGDVDNIKKNLNLAKTT